MIFTSGAVLTAIARRFGPGPEKTWFLRPKSAGRPEIDQNGRAFDAICLVDSSKTGSKIAKSAKILDGDPTKITGMSRKIDDFFRIESRGKIDELEAIAEKH